MALAQKAYVVNQSNQSIDNVRGGSDCSISMQVRIAPYGRAVTCFVAGGGC
jgi:hypothetical protein